MHKYRLISKKGEGTFSEVLKAQSIKTGKYLAIKCMKNHFDSIDQVNNLREIQALRRLSPNPGIIKRYEVLYDQPTGRLALVFELMNMNIYELIRGKRHYLAEDRVKGYMYQLVKSMDHMHRNGIFHRDIKPENVLISDEVLKVADFGSCRGIYSKQPYTEYISTRWYRAPECLLTDGYYGYKMDMWGVGCVMFEIIALFPLFPGTNELDQIERIHNIMGTPPVEILNKFKKYATHIEFNFVEKKGTGIAKLIPHASDECIDIIEKLLAYDPEDRLSARQALRHPYFAELRHRDKKAEKLAKNAKMAASARSKASKQMVSPKQHTTSQQPAQNIQPPIPNLVKADEDNIMKSMTKKSMYAKESSKLSYKHKEYIPNKSTSKLYTATADNDASKQNRGNHKIKDKGTAYYEAPSNLPGVPGKPKQESQSLTYDKSRPSMLPTISKHSHHLNQPTQQHTQDSQGYYGGSKTNQYKTSYSSKNYGTKTGYSSKGWKHDSVKSKVHANHGTLQSHMSHNPKAKRYYAKYSMNSKQGSKTKSKSNNYHGSSNSHHGYPPVKTKSQLQPVSYRSKAGRSTGNYVSPYSQKYIATQRLAEQ